MTIDMLKRVMIRIRMASPGAKKITQSQLRKAIIIERGHCMATYYNIKKALIDIGWLKTMKTKFLVTGLDITEDYDYA